MNSGTFAGLQPRTETEVPNAEKSRVPIACDLCGEREAEGIMPDGQNACRPCARNATAKYIAHGPVDPDVGDSIRFRSQGAEFEGIVRNRVGENLIVEVSVLEEIAVEQVVEVVEDGDEHE